MGTGSHFAGRIPPPKPRRREPGRYPINGWETVNKNGARSLITEDMTEWVTLHAGVFVAGMFAALALVAGLVLGALLGWRFL